MNDITTVRHALAVLTCAPGYAVPAVLVLDPALPFADAAATVRAAQALYGFWASGDESLLARAVTGPRTDDRGGHRSDQAGPAADGAAAASRALRAAVPDLTCTVEELVVQAHQVTARLCFSGTFTGVFLGIPGNGQPIGFTAVDVLPVTDGRVAGDWHLKDCLTLLTELGAVHALTDGRR